MKSFLTLTFLVLFFTSCATDSRNIRSDINDLKREVNTLKKMEDPAKIKNMVNAMRESQEELNNKIAQLNSELQMIQGNIDKDKYRSEDVLNKSQRDYKILKAHIDIMKSQMSELQAKITALEKTTYQGQITRYRPEKEKIERLKAPELFYKTAYNTFEKGQYKEAREKFKSFMKKYPTSSLTDNAYFWIAETYYREGNYEDAIIAYERMIKKYPNSNKHAASLLKQAYSFIELNNRKTARVILEKLLIKHPESKEAKLARERLKSL